MVYADFYSSWLDRLPFVLLFGIATSAESFEERLAGNSLRYLDGQKFDVTQSDEIIEKLFRATIAGTDARLHVGANLCQALVHDPAYIRRVQYSGWTERASGRYADRSSVPSSSWVSA